MISNNTAHGYKHPKNFHICNIMFHLSYFLDYQSDIKTTAGFHALFVIEPTLTKTQGFKRQLTLNLAQYEEIHTLIVSLKNEYETKLPGYHSFLLRCHVFMTCPKNLTVKRLFPSQILLLIWKIITMKIYPSKNWHSIPDCPPDISAGSFSAYTALVLQNI